MKYETQKKLRKNTPGYETWYGWRKDKNSEKFKKWSAKISQTMKQKRLDLYREKRLKKQKIYTHDIQRSSDKA